ncbi:unnamed protein product [Linum trigynum]|uniref:Uncharacterized protein n=1 Tax=Linum trigynum TaxID=586398 RepID=A0AAV2EPM5_9ROSI
MGYDEKIRIISTETIKPSSPTPSHLAKFNLSLVDYYTVDAAYMPHVFFYPAHGSKSSETDQRLQALKSSLVQALARFYPLAGRLSAQNHVGRPAHSIIHCNDEGIPFSTARGSLDSPMTLFLARGPDADSLEQFLPFPAARLLTAADIESAPQFVARATIFPCGGIAVGICALHKIMDAHTVANFMNLWAAVARGQGSSEVGAATAAYAHYRAATSLFPLNRHDVGPVPVNSGCEEGKKMVTRRFVFDGEAISALKCRGRSDPVPNPTRSEVVAAFMWKSVVNATAEAVKSTDGGKAKPITVQGLMKMKKRKLSPSNSNGQLQNK